MCRDSVGLLVLQETAMENWMPRFFFICTTFDLPEVETGRDIPDVLQSWTQIDLHCQMLHFVANIVRL